jgi:hypothetical protein
MARRWKVGGIRQTITFNFSADRSYISNTLILERFLDTQAHLLIEKLFAQTLKYKRRDLDIYMF